jgi:hypothetical protein
MEWRRNLPDRYTPAAKVRRFSIYKLPASGVSRSSVISDWSADHVLSTSAAPFNRYSFDDDPTTSIPARSHLSTEPNSRNRRKHRNIHSHYRVNETRSFALDRFKARRSLFAWLFLPTSFGATEVLSPRKISLYFCLLNRNGRIFFLDLRNNYPTSVDANIGAQL